MQYQIYNSTPLKTLLIILLIQNDWNGWYLVGHMRKTPFGILAPIFL